MAVRAVAGPSAPLVSVSCFLNRASVVLQRRVRAGAAVAVVVAGVAETGRIRGSAGGPAADEVVRAVAEWVLALPGPADSAVLMGGGEFAILCGGVRDSAETDTIMRRIRAAMARHFEVGGGPVSVATAAGLAMASRPEDTAQGLIAAARRAMRVAWPWGLVEPAAPVQAGPAWGASSVPGLAGGSGNGGSQVATAGHTPAAAPPDAGMALVEGVIRRLFDVGVRLESAAGLADGVVAEWIGQAVDELDAIIRDARTVVFGVHLQPSSGGGFGD
jgi:GGDEF domain-containing protein